MVKYFKDLENAAFHTFFKYLREQVSLNQAAWNIPLANVTALAGEFTTYDPLYLAIVNKQTRTPQQVDDHTAGRTVAENFIAPFANEFIINNSNISNSTKEALGFNPHDTERHERPQIEGVPFAGLDALPGSRIEFTNRTQSDASRASMHPDADVVEVRYMVGTQPPATVSDCPLKEISTKAKFAIGLPPAQAGQKIFAFVRWRNNSEPEKSGPYGDMLTTTVRS
jgi:hypothetical protein